MPLPSKNTNILENAEAYHREDSDTSRCSCIGARSRGSGTDAQSRLQSSTASLVPCLESSFPMTPDTHAATITPISPFSSSSMLPIASPATRGRNLTKDFHPTNSRSSSGLRTGISLPTVASSHNTRHLAPGDINNDVTHEISKMTRLSPPTYTEIERA